MQKITEMIQQMYQRENQKCSEEVKKLDTDQDNSSAWICAWGRVELLREIARKLNISL